MTTKILLTGATGFVGRQVLIALQAKDVDLTLIIRPGSEQKIHNDILRSKVIFSEDLFAESVKWWEKTCQNIDIVVHLAWLLKPGEYLYSDKNMICYKGSVNIAKGAAKSGVRRLVSIGTCFEYKVSSNALTVNSALEPMTPYAEAKVKLYKKLSSLLSTFKIEFAWCRLFYLYGEFEDKRRFVPYLRSQLEHCKTAELSSGKQIRDFMDVKVAGQSIADITLSNENGAVNVCSEIPISIREFAEMIADEYGRRDLLNFGARPDNKYDPPYIVGKK